MTARQPAAMVLAPHEVCDGGVRGEHWLHHDVRVPRPLRTHTEGYSAEEHTPRVVGHSPYLDDRCRDGRHLFDVIESARVRYVEQEDGSEVEEIDFRARLTCVRCGKVLGWEGTRTEEHVARVEPTPLVAGDLVAQMIKPDSSWSGQRDMSTWGVYRAGERVGIITWGCGPRGRAYFAGRLAEWPEGETVEAPEAAGVLRKLARAAAKVAS